MLTCTVKYVYSTTTTRYWPVQSSMSIRPLPQDADLCSQVCLFDHYHKMPTCTAKSVHSTTITRCWPVLSSLSLSDHYHKMLTCTAKSVFIRSLPQKTNLSSKAISSRHKSGNCNWIIFYDIKRSPFHKRGGLIKTDFTVHAFLNCHNHYYCWIHTGANTGSSWSDPFLQFGHTSQISCITKSLQWRGNSPQI